MENTPFLSRLKNRKLLLFVFLLLIIPTILLLTSQNNQKKQPNRVWKSGKQLIQEKKFKAPEKILEITILYDATASPSVSFSDVRLLNGYVPYHTNAGNYSLQIIDSENKIIQTIAFGPPTIVMPPPQTTDRKDNNRINEPLDKTTIVITIRYSENISSLRLLDSNGKTLAIKEATNLSYENNEVQFQSLEEEDQQSLLGQTFAANNQGQLTILFISNNYSDMNQFNTDISYYWPNMLSYEPFKSMQQRIRFAKLENTRDLNCKRLAPPYERALVCDRNIAIAQANNNGAPFDKIIVVNKDTRYGGAAEFDDTMAYVSNFTESDQVFVHESGHTFGLWDEYVLTGNDNKPLTSRDTGIQANCYGGQAGSNLSEWPWQDTRVPPEDGGCKYQNWYRSTGTSLMKELSAHYFNTVSQRILAAKIDVIAGSHAGENPQDTPTPTPRSGNTPTPTPSGGGGLSCTPGNPIASCSTPCPNGQQGTCGGHTYCIYDSSGNRESACACETAAQSCSGGGGKNDSCKDNPVSPPNGYRWRADCARTCSDFQNHSDCPRNTSDPQNVNPATSNWCYGFSGVGHCLMLTKEGGSGGSNSCPAYKPSQVGTTNLSDDMYVWKRDCSDSCSNNSQCPPNEDQSGFINPDTSNWCYDGICMQLRYTGPGGDNPSQYQNGGGGPVDGNRPTSPPRPTNTPTPTPTPLPAPKIISGICGTGSNTPRALELKWSSVSGAKAYAVRVDEDPVSWNENTPNKGDSIVNSFTDTTFRRCATAGKSYDWWIHAIDNRGIYGQAAHGTKITCASLETPTIGSGLGIGTFIPVDNSCN